MDIVECLNCSGKCGEKYNTQFLMLNTQIYCSINCYKELRLKTEELNERSKEKSAARPRNGRTKKGSRKNTRRSKSSKSRV